MIRESREFNKFYNEDERIKMESKKCWPLINKVNAAIMVLFTFLSIRMGEDFKYSLVCAILLAGFIMFMDYKFKNKDERYDEIYYKYNSVVGLWMIGINFAIYIISSQSYYGIGAALVCAIVSSFMYLYNTTKRGIWKDYSDKDNKKFIIYNIVIEYVCVFSGITLIEKLGGGITSFNDIISNVILCLIISSIHIIVVLVKRNK